MSEEIRKLAEQACGTSKDSPEYARFISSINPTLLLDLTAAQSELTALREELDTKTRLLREWSAMFNQGIGVVGGPITILRNRTLNALKPTESGASE